MREFNDELGIRRRLIISNMTVQDAEDYYSSQFYSEPKEKTSQKTRALKKRIKGLAQEKPVYEWILAVKTLDGKWIGKLEIYSADSETASLRVEIPCERKIYEYGVDTIKQFRKICQENSWFKRIELEENEITQRYKKAYALEGKFIEL